MKPLVRQIINLLPAVLALVILPACQTMDAISEVGAAVGQGAGVLTPQQAQSVKKAGSAVGKTFDSITPEQEYYIGRTVGAVVINQYKPLANEEANHYLNVLGQTLAQFSDKPETFGGYHFLIMETEEINAFSAPGGLVFISRGMLKCCKSEDAVAAVLAHEIGHVEKQHGLQAIKKSRITSALTILAVESGKSLGGEDLAQLTEAFEGSIGDITSTMMNSGYARGFERQADQAAVTTLQRAGYDPRALVSMLTEMKKYLKPGGRDFAKTHPAPDDRIADVEKMIGAAAAVPAPVARQARFAQAVGKI
ncbi:MAG: M48 family metalloprotease [Verrucomicrobia bacterium]|nr:M48 family metalloprotease [Verrucomicrobiota bacterium]MCG2681939.1 M48 family metalloprotease [Kiritimatiellia bacterium]MBU4247139.1 M48 family metalloprotease [Verrucomicrobiota bacterium]MBU4290980.1 M48 family metalloprotease [Verrucomicrobiota bacterium]MBU4430425.1 M48 family metalloprotease [Verrucomicrobiota bacterium]